MLLPRGDRGGDRVASVKTGARLAVGAFGFTDEQPRMFGDEGRAMDATPSVVPCDAFPIEEVIGAHAGLDPHGSAVAAGTFQQFESARRLEWLNEAPPARGEQNTSLDLDLG